VEPEDMAIASQHLGKHVSVSTIKHAAVEKY
jgi:hypothetical protein